MEERLLVDDSVEAPSHRTGESASAASTGLKVGNWRK
jgi:hypothetical protein